jgi:tetrahydromethanopterin S-methyltransferase subunit C
MESLKKWNKRSEKIWLVISIISTISAIYFSVVDDFANNKAYYLLTVMSWGIYLIRRGLSYRLGNKKQ